MALTPLQQAFCEEYLVDLNATQAAIRAGYAAKYANRQASENLSKLDIQEEIARLMAARSARVQLRADEVLRELRRLALSDVRKLYGPDGQLRPPAEWDDDTAAAVAGVEADELFDGRGEGRSLIGHTRKVRLWDKGRAIGQAMDHLGLSNKLTLETIFALLEPPVADALRRAIGEVVSRGGAGPPGGDPAGG